MTSRVGHTYDSFHLYCYMVVEYSSILRCCFQSMTGDDILAGWPHKKGH